MANLAGKTALITGGGTGLGYGVARRFLDCGANILIAGIEEQQLIEAAQSLQQEFPGGNIRHAHCDITDEQQVIDTVASIDQLDILVANAGSGAPGPLLELDIQMWHYACTLNIVGTALCIKHAARAMRERGGAIVTISSIAATRPSTWMAPYSTTKAGVEMMTRCAAAELGQFGIRANCIAPGWIDTEATVAHLGDVFRGDCIKETPMGRAGLPDDVADTAVYLATEQSRWVTGQVIGVDGGMSLHVHDYEQLSRTVYGDELVDTCKK